jgi:hypothetical protein
MICNIYEQEDIMSMEFNDNLTFGQAEIVKKFSLIQDIKFEREKESEKAKKSDDDSKEKSKIRATYEVRIKKMSDRMINLVSAHPEYEENNFAVHFIQQLINNRKDDYAYLHLIAYLQPIRHNIIKVFLSKYAVIMPQFTEVEKCQ